jgi:hypothetical protein
LPRDRAERPSSNSEASAGMRRWPGNERAVLSARCLGLAEPDGATRTSGEGASTGTGAKRRVPPIETVPDIRLEGLRPGQAPENPQQPCHQVGRRTACNKKNNICLFYFVKSWLCFLLCRSIASSMVISPRATCRARYLGIVARPSDIERLDSWMTRISPFEGSTSI